MAVKLSNATVVTLAELFELLVAEVGFADEFDGEEALRAEASRMYTWRAL
jgi:hypothetical protein